MFIRPPKSMQYLPIKSKHRQTPSPRASATSNPLRVDSHLAVYLWVYSASQLICSASLPTALSSSSSIPAEWKFTRRWPITRFQFLHNCASNRTYRRILSKLTPASAVFSVQIETIRARRCTVVETSWISGILSGQCLSQPVISRCKAVKAKTRHRWSMSSSILWWLSWRSFTSMEVATNSMWIQIWSETNFLSGHVRRGAVPLVW